MPTDSPYLVLGTAFGLGVGQVRVFVESLRRHYVGPAMLLVTSARSADLVAYLKSRGVTPVFFDCPYWMVAHVQVARYVRYGELLRGGEVPYERVLLTDVSDVLFQAHPFAAAPAGELLCFLEHPGRTIGACPTNARWVEQLFGPGGLARVRDKPISCSGTTIGTPAAVLDYIDRLLSHADPVVLSRLAGFRGHDQGIHNYLLYTGALPRARLVPNGEHVYTLGFVPDAEIILGPGGTVLAPGSRVCPIVHQYNYKPGASAHITAAQRVPEAGREGGDSRGSNGGMTEMKE